MSKIGTLTAFLEGMHVMGRDGLRDYHVARLVVNASRKRDLSDRLAAAKVALRNHRVTVSIWCDDVCVKKFTDSDGSTLACPKSWHMKG